MVYRSLIESVLAFNLVSWYGNVSEKGKAKLARVVNTASKVVGRKQRALTELYHVSVRRKSVAILRDDTHPLHSQLQYLPSGRRLRVPLAKKNLYKKSFIPSAVSILNAANSRI